MKVVSVIKIRGGIMNKKNKELLWNIDALARERMDYLNNAISNGVGWPANYKSPFQNVILSQLKVERDHWQKISDQLHKFVMDANSQKETME